MTANEPSSPDDASDPAVASPADPAGDDADAARARILLLIARDANRQQLASWLSRRYEVDANPDSVTAALDRCDLCLVDDSSFGRHREALVRGKRDAEPTFLPYLLVRTERAGGDLADAPWDVIDDIIRTPIRQAELRARIGVLLRTHDYSTTLAQQNEQLENFASVVSHDLRNPLNVAQGRLTLAQSECDSEHLAHVEHAHDRMERLITDVLTFAREGATAIETEVVDLAATVEQCLGTVATDAATLVTETDRSIHADRSLLQQLFENLVRNAVEHGSTGSRAEPDDSVEHSSTGNRTESGDAVEHGSTSNRTQSDDGVEHGHDDVTITVGELPEGRGLYVEDDGPGMPEEVQQRVFENGYSTSDDGTGFGLAIVRKVADAHGWDVRVTDSEAGGARFEITGVEFADE